MDIGFHIPDLLYHHRLNIILFETMKKNPEYFYEGVKIASVYGTFPGAVWNGGRLFIDAETDDKTMRMCIEDYNSRGIPVRFTFTNPLITKEHLGNSYCNRMLRAGNNGMNDVIINSPVLEEYIRENYPNYKITSSTCKELRTAEAVNAELEKDYNIVVLDYNWNNNFEFLEKLDHKDKVELLINACCIPNCPRRGEHYRYIGQVHLDYEKARTSMQKSINVAEFQCPYRNNSLYDITEYPTYISPEDIINKYAPMGFKHFKIEGRSSLDVSTLEYFVHYMVKPEYQGRARLEMSAWLTENSRFI